MNRRKKKRKWVLAAGLNEAAKLRVASVYSHGGDHLAFLYYYYYYFIFPTLLSFNL